MKKLFIPLGILGLILILKNNNSNANVPGNTSSGSITADAVASKINETFEDNNLRLRADVIQQITAELKQLSTENLKLMYQYFDSILNAVS